MADEIAPRASTGQAVPHGESRASYEDRDRVVEVLRVSAGDGRLTAEELDERVEAALTARTYNELAALVADLPSVPGAAVSMPAARPREVVRIDCQHGNTNRQGRWTVPQRMEVRINSGNVTLDFTDADITWPALQIDTEIHHGNMNLVTKPGIVVNTDDLAVHGSNVKVGAVPGYFVQQEAGVTLVPWSRCRRDQQNLVCAKEVADAGQFRDCLPACLPAWLASLLLPKAGTHSASPMISRPSARAMISISAGFWPGRQKSSSAMSSKDRAVAASAWPARRGTSPFWPRSSRIAPCRS